MRTTISLDDDVAAAVENLCREEGLGRSQAVNLLARRGLAARPAARPFTQRTAPLGITIDVRNVAEALELIEGPGAG